MRCAALSCVARAETCPPPEHLAAASNGMNSASKPGAAAAPSEPAQPAQLAKAALRRLALDRLAPTPENYAAAYQKEQGVAPLAVLPPSAPDVAELSGAQLALLIDRIVQGLERGGRQWTLARRKEGLRRVLDGSRGDTARLQQHLGQLLQIWDSDGFGAPGLLTAASDVSPDVSPAAAPAAAEAAAQPWSRVVASFDRAVRQALPARDTAGRELAEAIAQTTQRLQSEGATQELADELDRLCGRADWVLQHREHLMDQLGALCIELTHSLAELAEDSSWAQGQSEAMCARLQDGLTARSVKSASELLRSTRNRQAELRVERNAARQALKSMIQNMLTELGELGQQTGRFQDNASRYVDVVEAADSLESLAGVVREMVDEGRAVHAVVSQTRQRLNDEHSRATTLAQQVEQLEGELRRLSNEVSTDPLTQVANRRGLQQAFEVERARSDRSGAGLAIGLLDIDNFKRLNDELGHVVGDEALKSLAALVRQTLRPTDVVARYGGEEFVVLLVDTRAGEGQQVLTRLQRSLSVGLFMHEQQNVLVTFSAGVTEYRHGERIEDVLERADQALYEAKRMGKNRTCVG